MPPSYETQLRKAERRHNAILGRNRASSADTDADLRIEGEVFFGSPLVEFGDRARTYVPLDKLEARFWSFSGMKPCPTRFRSLLFSLVEDGDLKVSLNSRKDTKVWRGHSMEPEWVSGVDLADGRGKDSASTGDLDDTDVREVKVEKAEVLGQPQTEVEEKAEEGRGQLEKRASEATKREVESSEDEATETEVEGEEDTDDKSKEKDDCAEKDDEESKMVVEAVSNEK